MRSRVCRFVIFCAVAALASCSSPQGTPQSSGPLGKADEFGGPVPKVLPKRIILMIGDGMGVGAITGAAYAKDAELNLLTMSELAFMTTHEHEFVTTDSAASATAMASGTKTHFEAVGVEPGTTKDNEEDAAQKLRTTVQVAKDAGWKTGLIATTTVVDATPAAFAAHRASRRSKEEIALDITTAGVDVLMGGGSEYFEDRDDGQNLIEKLADEGYSVARTKTGAKRVADEADKLIALVHESDMPPVADGTREMALSEMVDVALEVLDEGNGNGFFLMVEGSQIDRRGHDLDGPGAIAEAIDFDRAVGAALEFARNNDDTLVVVTADHETGGLAIIDPDAAQPFVDAVGGLAQAKSDTAFRNGASSPPFASVSGHGPLFPPEAAAFDLTTAYGFLSLASRSMFGAPSFVFRGTHSPTMVPLFAEGPAAAFIAEVRDNAELGARLLRLVSEDGGDGSGQAEVVHTDETPQNVIVIVADQVGLPGVTAAQYVGGNLATTAMPFSGLVATHADNALVNDTLGAASQLATGAPMPRGTVSTTGGGDAMMTWFDTAEGAGMATGLVTTASVTDPALAPLYLGASELPAASDVASALVSFAAGDGIDLVFGGGRGDFGTALLNSWREVGVTVDSSWSDTPASPGEQLVRLVTTGPMASASSRMGQSSQPTLAEMTTTAIESLEAADDGFLLVVHAGGVGPAISEFSRGRGMIDEILDLDGAVAAAVEFAQSNDNTVVVVTSLRGATLSLLDTHYGFHKNQCGAAARCGGDFTFEELAVAADDLTHADGFFDSELQGDFSPTGLLIQYSWLTLQGSLDEDLAEPGAANFAPLFAAGVGAHSLRGFRTQPEVGATIAGWLDR